MFDYQKEVVNNYVDNITKNFSSNIHTAFAMSAFYDDDDINETLDNFILKGMEQDTINEIASRLNGTTKWHKAFKSLVK